MTAMDESAFTSACAALTHARHDARRIGSMPANWIPADLESAYRLQRAAARPLGETRGWKVSALTEAQGHAMGVSRPVCGPLLAPWVHDSPATFDLRRFIEPRIECEYAFELAHDLPERAQHYSRAEVEAAIGALRIVVEVTDTRLPPASPFLMQLADGFNNGAFVVGPAITDWSVVDFAGHPILLYATSADGRIELARGNALPILEGDPLGAVVLLANNQAPGYGGLRAGQIVTTGTCTGQSRLPGRCEIEAEFGTLGQVRLRFE